MPKVNDIKAYWKEVANKAGLSEDEMKTVAGVLDNDKFAKAFNDGFKPLPDYSHDLDDVRNRTKAEGEQGAKDAVQRYYESQKANFDEYLRVIDGYKKYQELYGDIGNPNGNNGNPPTNGGTSLTREEFEKAMDTRMQAILAQRDRTVLDLMEIRENHMGTFKKPLDTRAFEDAWKQHPEWGGSITQAYKNFVEPDIRKAESDAWEAKLKAAREEGIRDGYSRRAVPTDSQPKTFSPLFDRKEDVSKLSDRQQEDHSRQAFFDGLADGMKQPS